MRQIALLRGINVGGNNKIPMKDLSALFTSLGCRDVKTLIQSGNVVFEQGKMSGFAEKVSAAINEEFGHTVPVILRTAEQLGAVIAGNPWLKRKKPLESLHVGFLSTTPEKALVAALDPKRSPTDEFIVVGSEIYFHFPNGLGNSKITSAWLDSKLKTVCTVRNWNTVLKLHALSAA